MKLNNDGSNNEISILKMIGYGLLALVVVLIVTFIIFVATKFINERRGTADNQTQIEQTVDDTDITVDGE
jgi:large-conductance mechanosensitive channel